MNLFNHRHAEILRLLKEIEEAEAGEIKILSDIRRLDAGILIVLERIDGILSGQHKPSGLRIDQLLTIQVSHDKGKTWYDHSITQLQPTTGVCLMPITGIQAGGPGGTFTETPTPAGSAFPAGTTFTWTADDPNVVLTPNADGTATTAQTPATDTAASFNLTCTSNFNSIAGSVSVPILPAAVQPPTGLTIDQTA